MKKLIFLVSIVFLFSGCATIEQDIMLDIIELQAIDKFIF